MKKHIIVFTILFLIIGGCSNNTDNDYDEVDFDELRTRTQLLEIQIEELNLKFVELKEKVTFFGESLIEEEELENGKYIYSNPAARISLVFEEILPDNFEAYAYQNSIRIQYNDGLNIEPYVLRFYLQDQRLTEDTDFFLAYDSNWNLHYEPPIGYFVSDEDVIEIIEEFRCNIVVNNEQLFNCPSE